MKTLTVILLGLMGLAGCVSYDSTPPRQWPPANVHIDPQGVYVTGISSKYMEQGREEALANAMAVAQKMGLKDFALSEVCQDLHFIDPANNVQMIRIYYRVVPLNAGRILEPTK